MEWVPNEFALLTGTGGFGKVFHRRFSSFPSRWLFWFVWMATNVMILFCSLFVFVKILWIKEQSVCFLFFCCFFSWAILISFMASVWRNNLSFYQKERPHIDRIYSNKGYSIGQFPTVPELCSTNWDVIIMFSQKTRVLFASFGVPMKLETFFFVPRVSYWVPGAQLGNLKTNPPGPPLLRRCRHFGAPKPVGRR